MKRAAVALVVLLTTPAEARDEIDLRGPVRFGFAYTALSRAPAFTWSWGLEADLIHVTPRLAFTAAFDFDTAARPDLPDKDPRSAFSDLGLGAGFFYCTEGDIGFGATTTVSITFNAQDVTGASFATRFYVIPFYLNINESVRHMDNFGMWVRSSLSFWVSGRLSFTGDGNGTTLGFGGSVDIMRIFFLPYLDFLMKKLR
jgi:hypothetical protein